MKLFKLVVGIITAFGVMFSSLALANDIKKANETSSVESSSMSCAKN